MRVFKRPYFQLFRPVLACLRFFFIGVSIKRKDEFKSDDLDDISSQHIIVYEHIKTK